LSVSVEKQKNFFLTQNEFESDNAVGRGDVPETQLISIAEINRS